MTWKEIIDEIKTFGDVQVDCHWFIVRSTFNWIEKNDDAIKSMRDSGVNLAKSQEATRRKENGLHILETLRNQPDKICKPFTPIREESFSIYPLKE